MEPKRDLAIILRSVPYEERHRVVTALTEKHGRVSALARNSIQSRRFGGTLDPFAASLWSYKEKAGANLWSLEGAEIKRSFEGIRQDFRRLSLASVLTELMLKIAPEGEDASELFRLHSNALALVDETPAADWSARLELTLIGAYISKALQWSGNQPSILECTHCGRKLEELTGPESKRVRGHMSDGGWACCGSSGEGSFDQRYRYISAVALRDWLEWMNAPIKGALSITHSTERELRELFEFIAGFASFHLPGMDKEPLKSLKFLGIESCLS